MATTKSNTNIYSLDLDKAEAYNAIKLPDGTWAARPGLVSCVQGPVGTDQRNVYAVSARSISGVLYHYVFNLSNIAIVGVTQSQVICTVYDDEWVSIGSVNVGKLIDATAPWTSAIVEGKIVFNSPGVSRPMWCYIGSTPITAERVASKIPDNTAIDLLPGLVCSFSNRVVWAFKNQIYVNEPASILTISQGIGFSGDITDIFQQGSGGNLLVVTTDGVYVLPPDGLSGYAYEGVISKIPHYSSLEYGNAASARGAVHGLTAQGLMNLNTAEVTTLTNTRRPRKLTKFFGLGTTDYRRAAQMYATPTGYLITFGRNQPFCVVDVSTGGIYWWDDTTINETIVGVCTDSSGDLVIAFNDGIRRLYGNVLTGAGEPALAIEHVVNGINSTVIREVNVTATSDGNSQVRAAIRSDLKAKTTIAVPDAAIVGTAIWGTGTAQEAEFRGTRLQFATRLDGIYLEIGFDADQRIENAAVKTITQSPLRVNN